MGVVSTLGFRENKSYHLVLAYDGHETASCCGCSSGDRIGASVVVSLRADVGSTGPTNEQAGTSAEGVLVSVRVYPFRTRYAAEIPEITDIR